MTFLTAGEFDLLKDCLQRALAWPFLDFLVASGCRFSEATALTPGDVDTVNEHGPDQPRPGKGFQVALTPSTSLVHRRLGGRSGPWPSRNPFWTSWITRTSICSRPPRVGPSGSTRWRGKCLGTRAWPRPSRGRGTRQGGAGQNQFAFTIFGIPVPPGCWALGVPLITVSAHLGHEDVIRHRQDLWAPGPGCGPSRGICYG